MNASLDAPTDMNNTRMGFLVLALGLWFGLGCARSQASSFGSAKQTSDSVPALAHAPEGAMTAGVPIAKGRALAVTAEIGVTVEDVDRVRGELRAEVARAGGYVAEASAHGAGAERVVRMELRVPTEALPGMRASFARRGVISTDTERVEDVTEERADLDARLRNAYTSEKRILEIMATKSAAIHEVIEAEKEVSRIRESIERMEGQKRTLDGRIELAKVNVTLSAEAQLSAWQTPGKSLSKAGRAGLRAAAALGVYSLMVLAYVSPVLFPCLVVVAAALLAFRARRRAVARRADIAVT